MSTQASTSQISTAKSDENDKSEENASPCEDTLMMASTSDMNSAIKLAVEEALKNGAKLNKTEIKPSYTIYIPNMGKLRDPRKPRKELSEYTKEQLKNKIINIVGKKYIHQLFEGTATHKLELEVEIPGVQTAYSKYVDVPTLEKIEALELAGPGEYENKGNRKYAEIDLEQEIYVRYIETLKLLVDTVDDYLDDHWLSLEPIRLKKPADEAPILAKACYENAEHTHEKLTKLYAAYRQQYEPDKWRWRIPKIWDGGNIQFTNFNEAKVNISHKFSILKEQFPIGKNCF